MRAVVTLISLLFIAPPQPAAAGGPQALAWLRKRIVELSSDPRIRPARVGVVVRDIRSGRVLVKVRGAEAFNVASNAKLVTAAAALASLGPEYRFKTVLYARRPARRRGRGAARMREVSGDLYLKGFGSPVLAERDLWQLARELRHRGITRVRGRLVIDESFFDGKKHPPLYESKQTDAWYRPPIGALSLESNVVRVQVRGGQRLGDPAQVILLPRSDHLRLVNEVTTIGRTRRSWVDVATRPHGGRTEVKVRGRVRRGYRGKIFRKRIEDPGMLTGYALLHQLGRRGIRVDGARVVRGATPAGATALAVNRSRPLAEILRAMNKRSNNFIAEQVLKVLGAEVLGAPGTSAKGIEATTRYLRSVGVAPGTYTFNNGSGLYDATSFTPLQIVEVLRRTYLNFRAGADFVASLSQAGVDGTLHHRLFGTGAERYIRAKTGTLNQVVTLSGYAGSSSKRGPLAFSILLNDLPVRRVREARKVADEVALAIVTYLER